MAIGLREAHGWSEVQIDRYLSAILGAPQVIPASRARNPRALSQMARKKWWIHLKTEVKPPLHRLSSPLHLRRLLGGLGLVHDSAGSFARQHLLGECG